MPRLMKSGRTFLLAVILSWFALPVQMAAADVAQQSPHQVIEKTTEALITVITEAKQYFDKDPERFYDEIERIIDPIVDFKSFARSVMGKYASKKRYMALKTDDERKHFVAQVNRFSDTFKEGLVKTYGKGLLTFNGHKIEIQPARASDIEKIKQGKSVSVTQLIHGTAEQPYVVVFKMRQNKKKQWKLRNVTIESINIGQVYRSQFDSAMQKYDKDMEKVIETWSVAPQEFSSSSSSSSNSNNNNNKKDA